MNIWIIKNIRFGYNYTISKSIRNQINSCLNDWLDDLLLKKSKSDDILIISGGLFINTNPSLISINDAHDFLKRVSSKLKVYLINTDKDVRLFDNELYSTLDIFSDMENIHIIKNITDIDIITVIPHKCTNILDREVTLNANLGKLDNITIPNIMQLDKNESKPGLIVFNTDKKKHIFIENDFSPKHITVKINDLNDFNLIDKNKHKNDFIHIELNNELNENKKLEVNIALHNLNAHSVKFIDSENDKEDEQETDMVNITDSLNIVDVIYDCIGEDNEIKKQFERVLEVYKK